MPSIFEGVYQQSVGIAGLHYIALGVGLTSASQLNARSLDKVYMYFKKKNGDVGKPEFRLRSCPFLVHLGLANAHTFGDSCHVCRYVGASYRVAYRGMDRSGAHALDSAGYCK